MNLTLHIVKKDLRSLRVPALLWLGVLLGEIGLAERLVSPSSVDMNWFFENSMILNLLLLVSLLLVYFGTAVLVLEDPLVGTRMFWATRPISRGRLLVGKVVTAAVLFGLLPVAVWLPWWVYCGFRPNEMLVSAGFVLTLHALVAVVALAIASLVEQLGRFFLSGLVLVMGLFVVALNMASRSGIATDLILSRILLAVAVLVLACGVTFVRQYLTRRTVPNAIGLIAGAGLAIVLNFSSPFNFHPLRFERVNGLVGADELTGEIQAVRLETKSAREGGEVDVASIAIKLRRVPAGIALSGGRGNVELRWADGMVFRGEDARVVVAWWNVSAIASVQQALGLEPGPAVPRHWDPETEAKRAEFRTALTERQGQRGDLPLAGPLQLPRPGEQTVDLRLDVPPRIAARLRAEAPSCQIALRLNYCRPELLGEMPVRQGASLVHGGRVELVGLAPLHFSREQQKGRAKSYLATMVTVTPPVVPRDGGSPENVNLYLVDREHAGLGLVANWSHVAGAPIAATISTIPFELFPPQLWRTNKWIEAPGWQESSRLAAVIFHNTGTVERALQVDRLELKTD